MKFLFFSSPVYKNQQNINSLINSKFYYSMFATIFFSLLYQFLVVYIILNVFHSQMIKSH